MLPPEHPDRIQIAFDDHRLVANAGLLLPATLALRLGLGELVDQHVDLGDAPGRANPEDKLLTLVASALATPTQPGAPPTSCGRPWDGCATPGPRDHSWCGPTAASTLMA